MRLEIKLEDNNGEVIARQFCDTFEGEDTEHFINRGIEWLGRMERYLKKRYGDQLTNIPSKD